MTALGRNRLVSAATALLLGSGAPALASDTSGRVVRYRVADAANGALLYTIAGWTEPESGGGGRVAVASKFDFADGTSYRERAVFADGTPPRCLSWTWSIADGDATVVAAGSTGVSDEAFPFLRGPLPRDVYPLHPSYALLGYALTHLGLGQRHEATFHYTLMDTALLEMELRIGSRETVVVPAGRYDAHRVRMRPTVRSLYPSLPASARPLVSFFVPSSTFWVTTAEPQTLVKMSGTIGPPGSPNVVVELVADGVEPRDRE